MADLIAVEDPGSAGPPAARDGRFIRPRTRARQLAQLNGGKSHAACGRVPEDRVARLGHDQHPPQQILHRQPLEQRARGLLDEARDIFEFLAKEISPETYEEWNRETGGKHLPERVKKSKVASRTRKTAKKR